MDSLWPSNTLPERERLLRARYRQNPDLAWVTHLAWTDAGRVECADAMHGHVHAGMAGPSFPFATEEASGGPHDDVVPGELLCAALAASMDAAIRVCAARLGVVLEKLVVIASGDLDGRGVLGDDVPVGIQSMRLEIQLAVAGGADPAAEACLRIAAERCCVILDTLRSGVAVELVHS